MIGAVSLPACNAHEPLPMERPAVLLAPMTRWTALRKLRLLQAIDLGLVTEAQVCAAHTVDVEEVAAWRAELARIGISGLRALGSRICGVSPRNTRAPTRHVGEPAADQHPA